MMLHRETSGSYSNGATLIKPSTCVVINFISEANIIFYHSWDSQTVSRSELVLANYACRFVPVAGSSSR